MKRLSAALATAFLMAACGGAPTAGPAQPGVPEASPAAGVVEEAAAAIASGPAPETAEAGVADLDNTLAELDAQLAQLDTDLAAAPGGPQ